MAGVKGEPTGSEQPGDEGVERQSGALLGRWETKLHRRRFLVPAKVRDNLGRDVVTMAGPTRKEIIVFPRDEGLRFLRSMSEHYPAAVWIYHATAELGRIDATHRLTIGASLLRLTGLDSDCDASILGVGNAYAIMRPDAADDRQAWKWDEEEEEALTRWGPKPFMRKPTDD